MNSLLLFALRSRKFADGIIYRGQACECWELVPRIFRRSDPASFESSVAAEFLGLAMSRMTQPLLKEQTTEWLILMRHYGVPTRLLDWTQSPLVALYFAVCNEEHDKLDGTIWACSRTQLHSVVDDANDRMVPNLVKSAWVGERIRQVGMLRAFQIDDRLRTQQSRFTIHGDPTPLESYERAGNCLRWVRVPSDKKPLLRDALSHFGILRHELFPDLDSLGKFCASSRLHPGRQDALESL